MVLTIYLYTITSNPSTPLEITLSANAIFPPLSTIHNPSEFCHCEMNFSFGITKEGKASHCCHAPAFSDSSLKTRLSLVPISPSLELLFCYVMHVYGFSSLICRWNLWQYSQEMFAQALQLRACGRARSGKVGGKFGEQCMLVCVSG